nr:16S rRNA (uracil(1498)-N(3))-methyltransferase [Galbitalea soli]
MYLDEELGDPELDAEAVVTGAEARHAVVVGRLQVGEHVSVGNGAGLIASGVVTAAAPAEFRFRVDELARQPRREPAIWLAQALAKGDRDELAVQAATELGVDGVIPWAAARSVSRWEGAKIAKGQARWTALVREASKQSVRPWLPEVSPLVTTRQLAALGSSARLVVLDPESSQPLSAVHPDDRDLVLVVGPEGGISPAEFDLFAAAGALRARLGPEVLRTSTAGPAAIALLSAKLGRW